MIPSHLDLLGVPFYISRTDSGIGRHFDDVASKYIGPSKVSKTHGAVEGDFEVF